MGKSNIKATDDQQSSFPKFKAYSIDEILAAGGATAFANKLGKNFGDLEARLKELPEDAFLTDEEVEQALKTLRESK
ncbi:hypothetical protein KXD93_30025 [Mucilaginibacter sp. BJC16-A38]|uniref:hypothetical protein n=1 Tax=Mucilaginibacter phenanthrenivorans TaxID=1234842 RepID=UPI0021581AA6|nr:hypothetical protein [Mucilaginibacter phenanthrenivorans]MCR8561931.1 hypothetical protein [Mucilaginibacter phenanthrenivorans]